MGSDGVSGEGGKGGGGREVPIFKLSGDELDYGRPPSTITN